MWIRDVALGAVVAGGMIYWIWRVQPGAFIPWPQIARGLILMPLVMFAYGSLLVLVPTRVTVRADRIVIGSGGTALAIPAEKARSTQIETDDNGQPRLVVSYISRRGVHRTIERAIALSVDLDRLRELLAALAEGRRLTEQPFTSP